MIRNPCPDPARAVEDTRQSLVQVAPQLLALVRAVQFVQGLSLDLADSLTGETHHLPDLFEGLGIGAVDTEAQADDFFFLGVELVQGVAQQMFQRRLEQNPA